jgi:hypothetical protein
LKSSGKIAPPFPNTENIPEEVFVSYLPYVIKEKKKLSTPVLIESKLSERPNWVLLFILKGKSKDASKKLLIVLSGVKT